MNNLHTVVDRNGDAALAAQVAEVVSRPRSGPSNSFVLHAPLEVAARYGLLPFVDAEHRPDARDRILDIARQWEAHSPEVDHPQRATGAPADPLDALVWALGEGDVETADVAAIEIAATIRVDSLAAKIGDALLPCTTAAAHGPILLHLLPRVAPRNELPVTLMRPLARELAVFPDWRLRWIDRLRPTSIGGERLFESLASIPFIGPGSSSFIHPMLMQVDPTGIAEETIGGSIPRDDLDGARRSILRAAALSMLTEPDDHAAYGWSHCLTMPLAVLAIADRLRDPARAIAVAATYVVAFRATLAANGLPAEYSPPPGETTWRESFADGSTAAAASITTALRRGQARRAEVVETLATMAAVHPDAHLAKYTLACFDAAAIDPPAADLYLAACAHLHGVWSTTARAWED